MQPPLEPEFFGTVTALPDLMPGNAEKEAAAQEEHHGAESRNAIRRRIAREKLIRKAIAFMQEHLTDVTLAEVADHVGVSTRQLQRLMKEGDRNGFRDELGRLRVQEAARILAENPRITVAEAGSRVGYQGMNMSERFRKEFGMSPKQFQKLKAGDTAKKPRKKIRVAVPA